MNSIASDQFQFSRDIATGAIINKDCHNTSTIDKYLKEKIVKNDGINLEKITHTVKKIMST